MRLRLGRRLHGELLLAAEDRVLPGAEAVHPQEGGGGGVLPQPGPLLHPGLQLQAGRRPALSRGQRVPGRQLLRRLRRPVPAQSPQAQQDGLQPGVCLLPRGNGVIEAHTLSHAISLQECTGSICLAYGLESCQCSQGEGDSDTKPCELCCKLPGDPSAPCVSSFQWQRPPHDVPDMYSKPGTPCNNYQGYCDVFQKCREVSLNMELLNLASS